MITVFDIVQTFVKDKYPDLNIRKQSYYENTGEAEGSQIRIDDQHGKSLISIYPTSMSLYYTAPTKGEFWIRTQLDLHDSELFDHISYYIQKAQENIVHRFDL